MSMKVWLNISFFIVFTILFTQIAFPVGLAVKQTNVVPVARENAMAVFKDTRSQLSDKQGYKVTELLEEAPASGKLDGYHLFEYDFDMESTSLIPLKIKGIGIEMPEGYENRFADDRTENLHRRIVSGQTASKRVFVLVNTEGLSEEEIRSIHNNMDISVYWEWIFGLERENRLKIKNIK